MTNEDNASIRYLMKEMDPSEEVLMERAMMEDDDLLIEVECMRQTLKRLDELPEVDPPAHLTESIIREAVEYRKGILNSSRFLSSNSFKYAAAALVVIGTTVASLMIYDNFTGQSTGSTSPELTNTKEAQTDVPAVTQTLTSIQNLQDNTKETSKVEPWVDRNDIIHFQDQYSEDNTAFQILIKNSTEKLTPLNDSFFFNTGSRSLQLTGTGTSQ